MRQSLAVIPALWAVLALGSGCGTSICDRAETVGSRLQQDSAACREDGTGFSSTFDRDRCESGVTGCSDADLEILRGQFDCLDQVGVCAPESEKAWLDALAACTPAGSGISAECGTGGI